MKIAAALVWMAIAAGACQQLPAPAATATPEVQIVKALATVYISPTPDAEAAQATRMAAVPTESPPTATPSATPTVYIGTFLGEAGALDDSGAIAPLSAGPANPERPRYDPQATCPMQPDERFGTRWREAGTPVTTIGCPADVARTYNGTTQVFERGAMYWTPDGAIWAVAAAGTAQGQWWYAERAPAAQPVDAVPAGGLQMPALSFEGMWSAVEGVRTAMGFGRTVESSTQFTVQLFQNGALLRDDNAGQVFILIGAGTSGAAYGPY